jgi:hypothetical protein
MVVSVSVLIISPRPSLSMTVVCGTAFWAQARIGRRLAVARNRRRWGNVISGYP